MAQPFDRAWLSSEQQRAWRLLLVVMSQLPSDLNRQLQRDSPLSFQDFDVLIHLQESSDDRLRLGELAEALGWERSRTSHHVARMEARGMVRREKVDGDGRGAWVVATAQGREEVAAVAERHIALVRQLVFTGLDEQATTQLVSALTTIAANLGFAPRTMWHLDPDPTPAAQPEPAPLPRSEPDPEGRP